MGMRRILITLPDECVDPLEVLLSLAKLRCKAAAITRSDTAYKERIEHMAETINEAMGEALGDFYDQLWHASK